MNLCSHHLALDYICSWRVVWQKQVSLDSSPCRVGSQGAGGVPSRGSSHSFDSERLRHADCYAHAARLEAGGRIPRFVLDQEAPDTEASREGGSWQKRSPTFTECDRFDVERQRQKFAIAPERRLPRFQLLLGNAFGD